LSFQGEVPARCQDSVDGSDEQQAGPHDCEADRDTAGREAVQSTVRPHLTAKVDSSNIKDHPDTLLVPASSTTSCVLNQRVTSRGATLQQASGVVNNQTVCVLLRCWHPTGHAHLHSASYRRVFRTFKLQISSESSDNKCSGGTAAQKKRRHERNREQWTCGLCEHDPFGLIAGFRSHTIIEHKQNFSWTGNVMAPENDDHLAVITGSVRNCQSHKSSKRRRRKKPSPSTPSKSTIVDVRYDTSNGPMLPYPPVAEAGIRLDDIVII